MQGPRYISMSLGLQQVDYTSSGKDWLLYQCCTCGYQEERIPLDRVQAETQIESLMKAKP